MAITRSLERQQTPVFIVTARSVRLLRLCMKDGRGVNPVRSALVAKIKTHLGNTVPKDELKIILDESYVLPLRPARHDEETNVEKIAQEVVTAIAEPLLTRSLHFIAPVMRDHAQDMTSFLNKEIGRFVQTSIRTSSSGDIVFNFDATAMIKGQS